VPHCSPDTVLYCSVVSTVCVVVPILGANGTLVVNFNIFISWRFADILHTVVPRFGDALIAVETALLIPTYESIQKIKIRNQRKLSVERKATPASLVIRQDRKQRIASTRPFPLTNVANKRSPLPKCSRSQAIVNAAQFTALGAHRKTLTAFTQSPTRMGADNGAARNVDEGFD
jgi:hypothetical protein